MSTLAVITLDGVLRDESTDGTIPVGRALYHGLSEIYRLAVIADSPLDDMWLGINGYTKHQVLVERRPEDPSDNAIRRLRQIERLRGMGATVDLLVDPDPGVVAVISHMGVACLHYVDAPFSRPEFRPDYDKHVTPWDQMVSELDRTRALRAAHRPLENP
ncbi:MULTISPECIES: hypothetical protein [Streptosporangium]|uniref:Uncharacterized protein n=1 Tax=Streptosporangium brasiliense TaxID=47480 RepID=A0ABT9RM77_9ACTN|nr:hypothetical protein [Streptosporangium brasiliense]MDP9870401.1 hypothetical protein [Streptosporangium brasiliense]